MCTQLAAAVLIESSRGWLSAAAVLLAGLVARCVVSKRRKAALGVLTGALSGVLAMIALLPEVGILAAGERTFRARVDAEPRRGAPGALRLSLTIADPLDVALGATAAPVRVMAHGIDLPWRNAGTLERGDLLWVQMRCVPLPPSVNPLSADARMRRDGYSASCRLMYASRREPGGADFVARLRAAIASLVISTAGDSERGRLILSMAFGFRDLLSQRTEQAFRKTGLSHLLVVSGYQVSMMFFVLYVLAERAIGGVWGRLRGPPLPVSIPASAIGLLGGLGFVALTGGESASIRAGWAILFFVIAKALERGNGMFRGVLFSLLGVSILWPVALADPGIGLTFAALCGIAIGSSFASSALGKYVAVCAVTSLATSIVSLAWFSTFSLSGFLLNPLLAPLLSVLSVYGGVIGVLGVLSHVDGSGLILQGVGNLLLLVRDLLLVVAGYDRLFLEASGVIKYALLGGLLGIMWCLVNTLWLRFKHERGLAAPPPKRLSALVAAQAGSVNVRPLALSTNAGCPRELESLCDAKLAHLAQVLDNSADTPSNTAQRV